MAVDTGTGVHIPAKADKFEFDGEVAQVFDNMAERSICGYSEAYRVVGHLASRIDLPKYSQVWDLGTSTGKGLLSIENGVGLNPYLDYFGVDVSGPMLERAASNAPFATFLNHDLQGGLPSEVSKGKVAVMVFGWVLQFIESMEVRERLLREAFDSLASGGFIAVMEKYKLPNEHMDSVMQDSYISFRRARGYTLAEIEAKTTALKNSMWPASPEWASSVLEGCGADVHVLYRELNFGGIVAFKK